VNNDPRGPCNEPDSEDPGRPVRRWSVPRKLHAELPRPGRWSDREVDDRRLQPGRLRAGRAGNGAAVGGVHRGVRPVDHRPGRLRAHPPGRVLGL